MAPLLAGLLVSLSAASAPSRHAMAVPAYSWADGPLSWMEAPACLVRAEVWQAGVAGRLGNNASDAEWSSERGGRLAAGGPFGDLYAGAVLGASAGSADTLGASAAAAWLVTGDPISFMEGFFGPSVSLGASLEARSTSRGGGRGGELLASSSAQVAFFPTFSLGLGIRPSRVVGWGPDSLRSEDGYTGLEASCTYIFGRELRGHLGFGSGGASVGADLRVSDMVTVMAGTDGGFWGCGISARAGRLMADYGIRLTTGSASHAAGLWLKLGETSW